MDKEIWKRIEYIRKELDRPFSQVKSERRDELKEYLDFLNQLYDALYD
jgi:hypothetical protein